MNTLNYETLRAMRYDGYLLKDAPIRVLQFGEGNFLRAFVDHFVDVANERAAFDAKVALVQPIEAGGLKSFFAEQQGLYTLYLRGFENGGVVSEKRVISAVGDYIDPYAQFGDYLAAAHNPDLRYIVSNTTEAGIVYDGTCRYDDAPPSSFPAKLTRFLHERFLSSGKGLVILSCELIDDNGKALEACVMRHVRDWALGEAFQGWLERECLFCSTLVDRIVTGYPRAEKDRLNEENGYVDNLMDTGEVFGLWVIEGPEWLAEELPFERAGLPVKVVRDHAPYKKRKVRILNGAHTSMVTAAYLAGQDIVRDAMYDPDIAEFLRAAIWDEIIPVVPLPKDELEAFAEAVIERFKNPFIDHALLSITLNNTSKWRARVLPSLKGYVAQFGRLPAHLAFGLAAHIAFFRDLNMADGRAVGEREGQPYDIKDDPYVLEFYADRRGMDAQALAAAVLADERMWGEDLTEIPGLLDQTVRSLTIIQASGMRAAIGAIG